MSSQKFYFIAIFMLGQIALIAQPDSIDVKLRVAQEAYSKQNYQAAIEIYSEIEESGEFPMLSFDTYGIACQKLGDFKKAKLIFHEIEKTDTIKYVFAKSLASIYEIENNTPKAIKYYRLLADKFPTNSIYFRKLGQLNLEVGEVFDAFPNFIKAYALNDKDVFTIQGLSDILLANREYGQVDSLLNKAIAYDEENFTLNLLKARSKYKQRQYDSTAVVLEHLSKVTTLNNYYNKMLGYSLMQIDSLEKAILFLERSLVDEKNPENALYYLANAYEKKGNIEQSVFYYEQSIKVGVSENIAIYHRNLGRILDDKNETKKAIQHYEAAYRYSEDPLVLFYLARASDVYYKDKKIAMRYYKRYEKSAHDNLEYKQYAKDRTRYLKEQVHLSK